MAMEHELGALVLKDVRQLRGVDQAFAPFIHARPRGVVDEHEPGIARGPCRSKAGLKAGPLKGAESARSEGRGRSMAAIQADQGDGAPELKPGPGVPGVLEVGAPMRLKGRLGAGGYV